MKDEFAKKALILWFALYFISASFAACSLLNLPTGEAYNFFKGIVDFVGTSSDFLTSQYAEAAVHYKYSVNLDWLELAYAWVFLNMLVLALFLIAFSFRKNALLSEKKIIESFRHVGWKAGLICIVVFVVAWSANVQYDPDVSIAKIFGNGVILYSLFYVQVILTSLLVMLQNFFALILYKFREKAVGKS